MLIVFFLGLIAGVALQLQQSSLWQALAYIACTAAALAGLAVYRLRTSWLVRAAVFVLALMLSFGITGWRASSYLQTAINPAHEGADIEVVGIVGAMPQRLESGLRFRFEVEAAHLNDKPVTLPPRVLLSWYKRDFNDDGSSSNLEDASVQPKAGERWQFTVRLKAPHGNANPHGFDYELWMWEQGAGASGYVRENKKQTPPKRLGQVNWNAAYSMERARQSIRDKVFQRLGGAEERSAAGVIAALVAGDQAAIERADWDIFRATGVAHLMSISGLHITMFAWLASLLIGLAWRRSVRITPRLCLALPAAHAGLMGGLLLATLYAWFSGWGVPAQRTIWMLTTFSLLRLAGLRWPWHATWLLAAIVVLALDPWAMLQAGFWLSFVAVAVLFASDAGEHTNKAWSMLREQWIITIALAPLTLLLFQQVSLVGLLANAVAIPVVTLIVTPLAMLGVAFAPLWDVAALVMGYMAVLLKWLSGLPYAVYTAPAPPIYLSALAVLGGVLLVVPPAKLRARGALRMTMKTVLAAMLLAPALLWQPTRPSSGQFDLLAIDIGQGNALLIRTETHSLLFDAGPRFSRESDAGHRTIVPLLRALGERLDVLMLSHKDSDHTGGAKAVLAMQPQSRVLTSVNRTADLMALGLPDSSELCYAGQTWTWDGVSFDVLHPQRADLDVSKNLKPNAISCVLKVTSQSGASALLTADIETPQEQALLDLRANLLPATVLLVPHHGSKTSSSEAFLDAVNPKLAMVQAGYRNRFAHPRPEVMERYAERKIQTVESSRCGAAKWASDLPDAMTCQRQTDMHYWRHQIH
jgi:competence protein ComEC